MGGCLKHHLFNPRAYISQYYNAIVCQKFQKPSFAMLGAYYMIKNKVYWYRSEVCPEIGKVSFVCTFFNVL